MRQSVVAILMTIVLAGTAPAATTIHLQREATVTSATVRLGDVALVDGGRADELKSLVVCPSPLTGGSMALDRQRVHRRVLAALGGAEVELTGAEACTVSRIEATSGDAKAATVPVKIEAGRSLEQVLRETLRRKIDLPQGKYRIEFDPRDAADLSMTEQGRTFQVFNGPNEKVFGSGAFRVEILGGQGQDRLARTVYVRYRVVQLATVVVAARDIRQGEVLKRDDVRLEEREFRDERVRGLRYLDDVVGSTARASLGAGQVLCDGDITQTLLVRRGDVVTVYVYGRGFTLKTRCRALESGERGSTVALEGKDGRGRFYAQITDARTAELRLADAPSREARTDRDADQDAAGILKGES
ncbi:MAG: flagellar basal body P-ring formation protein FlgA [Planctomycetes bacterium]|nr:flagellar basal body P-ring formation protein FlgA [Planctomycetota bacterium]